MERFAHCDIKFYIDSKRNVTFENAVLRYVGF